MKHMILLAAGVLLFVSLPLIIWRLLDNPLERRIEPLIGAWLSRLEGGTTLRIRIDGDGGCITVRRRDERCAKIYTLQFDTCLHYTDAEGKRTDLFYAPSSDVLLLIPGGTFRRIHIEPSKP